VRLRERNAGGEKRVAVNRTNEKVSLNECRRRLMEFEDRENHHQLWNAATLAEIIWPQNEFLNAQGAGAAASRVLKKLNVPKQWTETARGYDLRWL